MEIEQGQRGKTWHVDKSVNVGYLLTSVIMAFSVIVWAFKMDTRVTVLEAQQVNQKENEAKTALLLRDNFVDIKESQLRIESKLDGKADK